MAATELTREQLVDRIREVNQTAESAFLTSFTARDLAQYLRHLEACSVPRGRGARWERPDGAAISSWQPPE